MKRFAAASILIMAAVSAAPDDTAKRRDDLAKLIPLLSLDQDEARADPRISPKYQNWKEWLDKSGELPPDFDRMPANADLPDPLVIEQGGREVPVTTTAQWEEKKAQMRRDLQHWLYGEMPPPPGNVVARTVSTSLDGRIGVREVELTFGPDHRAKMSVQLMMPEGAGPFPVFLTQWNHRPWALLAVRRGYLACLYAGADVKDDTTDYATIYPEYDFQVLARRAWGASRVVDFLYTLPIVDRKAIGITGHSRNGKQSLIAGAFDPRITAVISASPGTGGDVPARFDRDNFYSGDMSLHARVRRSWFDPRWRFFVGRENRLPVDAHSLVALIAPNSCLLDNGLNEIATSNWGVERVFLQSEKVYGWLGAPDKLGVRFRERDHEITATDIEAYLDFFDYAFGRGGVKPPRDVYHPYTFDAWRAASGEKVDPANFPRRKMDDLAAGSAGEWDARRPDIRQRLRWTLGVEPAGGINQGPMDFAVARKGTPDPASTIMMRPAATATMGKVTIAPYHFAASSGFGDNLSGDLYFPKQPGSDEPSGKLPVIIWLHPYSYSTGYGGVHLGEVPAARVTAMGYAMFAFDQIGCGTRVKEGRDFYRRYPHWSLMGKMVTDTIAAVDMLARLPHIDADRIYCIGYSMGATVGLYAAALDPRIKGLVSVSGFSPFRLDTPEKEKASAVIGKYSHIHGLLPRLGFFLDAPDRVPVDFDEVLALIAPRPLMVVAPALDWDNPQADVKACVAEARKVYTLLGAPTHLELFAPYDINRWTAGYRASPQTEVFSWCKKAFR